MWWGIGGAGLAALAALFFQFNQIGKLNQELATAQADMAGLEQSLAMNEETLGVCKDVNAFNAREAEEARKAVARAYIAMQTLRETVGHVLEDIAEDENELRENSDEVCRTLDEPLPVTLIDWVWDNEGSN